MYFLDRRPGRPAGRRRAPALVEEIQPPGARPARAARLGAAVRTVLDDLRGTAPAAIVLLTDGINTDGPPLDEAAA